MRTDYGQKRQVHFLTFLHHPHAQGEAQLGGVVGAVYGAVHAGGMPVAEAERKQNIVAGEKQQCACSEQKQLRGRLSGGSSPGDAEGHRQKQHINGQGNLHGSRLHIPPLQIEQGKEKSGQPYRDGSSQKRKLAVEQGQEIHDMADGKSGSACGKAKIVFGGIQKP